MKLLKIKEELMVYITGMKELGLIKNDNLLNTLIQHNETYLDQHFDHISYKIKAICESESYVEVEVLNQADVKKYIEFYGIELDSPVIQFPVFLPFSLMVKDINDSVQLGIDEIHRYCKNLFNEEDDYVLFYGSIDKLVCNIIEVLKEHFMTETQMGIPQIAVVCNNIEYMKRSIAFYQSCAFKHCKNNNAFEFNYTAMAMFNQLKSQCEEKLYNLFRLKINEFLSFVKEQDWGVKYPNETHNEYIMFIVEWLRVNLQRLEINNGDIVYSAAVTCLQHFCSKTMEILATEKHISKINMNDIENLSQDLQFLEGYIEEELREKYPRTFSALNELRQFINLMKGSVLDILDDEKYRNEFSALQMHKLQNILKKIKDKSKDKEVKKLLKAFKNK
mmetsp:Transcript_28329/g.25031  ORF Transcript_28329/g.25031 Transcript_28329/m.25031 type:complete len:391 (+) Transcript_28329:482-1654(+)